MKILEYNLNSHFDGLMSKCYRANLIKFQIDYLNNNGYDFRIVFTLRENKLLGFSKLKWYNYVEKTHAFEFTEDELEGKELESCEKYGIYGCFGDWHPSVRTSEDIKPLVCVVDENWWDNNFPANHNLWCGELYKNNRIWNSRYEKIAEELYEKMDRPEWCLYIRSTDKVDNYSGAVKYPFFVMCEEIEKRNIHKSPFLLMTDSNEVVSYMKQYENIRYFEDHYRSDDDLPLHRYETLKSVIRIHRAVGDQPIQEQKAHLDEVCIEMLVQLKCSKLCYNVDSGFMKPWFFLGCVQEKEPAICIWDNVKKNKYELGPIVDFYGEKLLGADKILTTLDEYLNIEKGKML